METTRTTTQPPNHTQQKSDLQNNSSDLKLWTNQTPKTNNTQICDSYLDCHNNKFELLSCLFHHITLSILKPKHRTKLLLLTILQLFQIAVGYPSPDFEKGGDQLFDKLNLEQSIAAVFNKVAYGSTTKRSIPDTAYPLTTLATPLLTTFRYTDGSEEWLRVDLKSKDFDQPPEYEEKRDGYGVDLEKDHALPTSAPAADILKNNNNKNYNNPNRYNNDRLRPDFSPQSYDEPEPEANDKTSTMRTVRPTKSMYSKEIPSYVPPSRAFFTPPLPPQYQNPFADKPTLRGTNSDGFASRRPIPPPSLMPNKDRIPYRPDLPPTKVNAERNEPPEKAAAANDKEKKKTLNTPSLQQNNVKLGEFYGLNRMNETQFEYEKSYAPEPSITRILSGSNGRHDDIQIPDILYRTVTATPQHVKSEVKKIRTPVLPPPEPVRPSVVETNENDEVTTSEREFEVPVAPPLESVVSRNQSKSEIVTTPMSDVVNLPNVKKRDGNVTKATSEEIWLICWNVHVYLVVFGYIILALYSIYKLIRYENDPHMFSKSYFLTIHLMLTVICVLRIFYLIYDPYNFNGSFNIFLYEFLHSFPLSLLATTFAVLILFLLKRTLTHLEVSRPVFLVFFALLHIGICFTLSTIESLGYFQKASLTVSRPIFVLLVLALGISYLYLYRIIKNVLAKRSQNLSEMCTQNISYASHITIAVALLFVLLGIVQLYSLFFIKVDRFNGEIKHHWMLWSYELSVRFIELSIITLLAIVVSLRLSQREKQTNNTTGGGFPLFPCATSDSSTDNIYPNNCNSNPNAMSYARSEQPPASDSLERKATLERAGWCERSSTLNLTASHFERSSQRAKAYDAAKYYAGRPEVARERGHIYSEPVDNEYERTRHEFEMGDARRSSSRTSSGTSGRRSRRARPHHGAQTLPPQQNGEVRPGGQRQVDSMLVDEQGFVRFRHMQEEQMMMDSVKRKSRRNAGQHEVGHFSDA